MEPDVKPIRARSDQIPSSLKAIYLGDEWKIIGHRPEHCRFVEADQRRRDRTSTPSSSPPMTGSLRTSITPVRRCPVNRRRRWRPSRRRVGDCDDQSNLFLGLIRAAGVPGWLQLGALYNPTSKPDGRPCLGPDLRIIRQWRRRLRQHRPGQQELPGSGSRPWSATTPTTGTPWT